MATIRKTTYRCDACGKEVESRGDLVQIRIEKGKHSRHSWQDTTVGAKGDFCDPCEDAFLKIMEGFYGKSIFDLLRRKPKRVKKDARKPATTG